jgi:hypothetical protein
MENKNKSEKNRYMTLNRKTLWILLFIEGRIFFFVIILLAIWFAKEMGQKKCITSIRKKKSGRKMNQ